MSTDRCMDKEDVICIYNGIWLSIKKNGNNAICSNRDEPRDYHTKWNKSHRERQKPHMISHMQSLKKNDRTELMYKNRNRPTDIENKCMIIKGEREDG